MKEDMKRTNIFDELRARSLILQILRKLLETPIEATLIELGDKGEAVQLHCCPSDLCTPEAADLPILCRGQSPSVATTYTCMRSQICIT
jgi:hypothetical protein